MDRSAEQSAGPPASSSSVSSPFLFPDVSFCKGHLANASSPAALLSAAGNKTSEEHVLSANSPFRRYVIWLHCPIWFHILFQYISFMNDIYASSSISSTIRQVVLAFALRPRDRIAIGYPSSVSVAASHTSVSVRESGRMRSPIHLGILKNCEGNVLAGADGPDDSVAC